LSVGIEFHRDAAQWQENGESWANVGPQQILKSSSPRAGNGDPALCGRLVHVRWNNGDRPNEFPDRKRRFLRAVREYVSDVDYGQINPKVFANNGPHI